MLNVPSRGYIASTTMGQKVVYAHVHKNDVCWRITQMCHSLFRCIPNRRLLKGTWSEPGIYSHAW